MNAIVHHFLHLMREKYRGPIVDELLEILSLPLNLKSANDKKESIKMLHMNGRPVFPFVRATATERAPWT